MTREISDSNPWGSLRKKLTHVFADAAGVDSDVMDKFLEVPPETALGDIACTIAFHLAKEQGRNPTVIATEIVKKLNAQAKDDPLLDRVESKGPYINLFVSHGALAELVIKAVQKRGVDFGNTEAFKGLRAMIESPAVNPSKPWHIGHTRNAVLGDTLGNILEAVGYSVLRIDYINDLGLQIAQLTWKLMKEGQKDTDQKYDHYLGHLYVDVQEVFEKDKKVEDEIREVTRDLEDLSSEASRVSGRMVTDCVSAQSQTAYRLGIYRDLQVWESTIAHSGFLDKAKEIMLGCDSVVRLEDGEKAGCIVAKLDTIEEFKDMKDPNKVLFRSDGTRTYSGADVAFQMWKFSIFEDPFQYEVFERQPNSCDVMRTTLDGERKDLGRFDIVLNVIGSAQAHPQRLIYSILDLLGFTRESENSHHIAYEFVGLEDVDFSGREGTWIGYSCDVVLDKAKELAREEVHQRNPDESDEFKDRVAESVGIGAVRYHLLNASPDRKITFRWETVLDFNGDAAPYLQYSLARAYRIMEKTIRDPPRNADLTLLSADVEYELVKAIAKFPEEILEVARSLKKDVWGTSFASNRITTFCYGLANLFSKFYDSSPVLKAEDDIRDARLSLVYAFAVTMENCLRILGIPIVDRM